MLIAPKNTWQGNLNLIVHTPHGREAPHAGGVWVCPRHHESHPSAALVRSGGFRDVHGRREEGAASGAGGRGENAGGLRVAWAPDAHNL